MIERTKYPNFGGGKAIQYCLKALKMLGVGYIFYGNEICM